MPKTTSPQMCMAEDAKAKGQNAPPAKYDIGPGFDMTRPKIFKLKIQDDKQKHINKYKIIKSKLPDVGTYEQLKSFKST
jgi:hypothetical protein